LADLHVQLGNTVKAVQILQALLQEYPADKEAQDQLKLIRSLCKPDDPEYGDCIQPLIDAQEGQELDQTCSGVPQKPLISVVMPGFTSRENLYRILDLFFINTRYPNYELTVVGPESIKAVIQNQASARRSRIKPFIVPEQLTFVEGMQRAAMSTSGAYIVLFGLHTAATQGWLNTLMKSVSDWPGCGAVTAKTIDMDGHIIEAGYSGLQKEKSEIESAGAGCQHDAPRYNYTCPVMSGSRCCLLVSREALQEAGGLDNVFEDIGSALIDLGLKIIAGGRTIVYQPKSLLVLRNNEPIRSPSSEGNQLDAEECERLRPMIIIPSAGNTSFTTGRKVLVLGVYLADQLNTVDDTVRVLSGSDKFKVIQRWTGLMGSPPTARVDEVTVDTLHERTPKFQIMNAMLKREDLNRFEYVIMTDDDVVLPSGFLDEFIGWQNRLNFAIAQPARTHNSYIDHCIVEQHNGLGARQTLFVEIGPVVSFHRSVFKLVFPFDLASSMGWGYENIWSYRLAEHKAKMGIIDGIPIDHSIRKPVANYTWEQADRQRSELLMKHPHLSLDECLRVVDVYQVGEVS
ncbi:MAG: hypothetical protein JXM72_07275, partial [Deltaproteobacteria bacterium]|nr:hypothetical protein [Deltaproteobacteria bacterium]